MAILGQAYLLLKKNFLLRIRYPGILVLELLWPVLIMGLVALMRNGAPPFRKPNCQYQPRAMPSAGAVPFLQTYVCNLDNPCYMTEGELNTAVEATQRFTQLTADIVPYLAANETLEVLEISNSSATVLTTVSDVISDQNLTEGLENFTYLKQYFQDPDEVRRILVVDYGLMTANEAQALMDAQFNIAELMRLTGTPDFKEVACDASQLSQFLIFPTEPDSASAQEVSEALCVISDADISGLTDAVVQELDIVKIMEALSVFEQLKEKFTGSSLTLLFDELAHMFELIMGSKSVIQAVGSLAAVPDISELIRDIPQLLEGFTNLNEGLASAKHIVDSLTPLMVSLGADDSNAWSAVLHAMDIGTHVALLVEGQWNGTTQEFIQPLIDLIDDLRALAQDETGLALFGALDFLSEQDWPTIYNEIVTTNTLSEGTVVHMLHTLEQMLSTIPGYDVVQIITRLTQHSLDVGSIFIEQSIALRQALNTSIHQSSNMQDKLGQVLQYGPDVFQAIMDAFLNSDILATLFTGSGEYTTVCLQAMQSLEQRVPADIATGVKDILCTDDVMASLTHLGDYTATQSIADIINHTVTLYTELYEGDFWSKVIPMKDLYYHYFRFRDALDAYLDDDLVWEDIVYGALSDLNLNVAGWEALLDSLNTDYLTSGILGLYQSMGQILVGSEVSDDMAPYIHVMSEAMRMTYDVLYAMTQTYSMENPLMTALNMVTTYLPEMINGLATMADKNMAALYNVVASTDPLATFCSEDILGQMDMPSYVPVGEMTNLTCQTDWAVVIEEFIEPAKQVEDMVNAMTVMIETLMDPSTAANVTYDIEGDWITMVDYTQRMVDLVNSGDVLNMDLTMGYLNYVDSIDWVKMGEGLTQALEMLTNDVGQDIQGIVEIGIGVMSALDQSMGDNPEWAIMRSYVAVIDSYMDMQIAIQSDIANATSIRSLLASYPPEMVQISEMVAKAYPDFVLILSNMLISPEKYLDNFMTVGFQAPDCNTRLISNYLMVNSYSSVYELEQYLCGLDWEQLFQSLAVAIPEVEAYMEKVTEISMDPTAGLYVTIDWVALARKVETYIQLLEQQMNLGNFDLLPFNTTTIDLSWETVYGALNAIQYWDVNRFITLATQVQNLALQTAAETGEDSAEVLATVLYANSYITYHVMKLLNTELAVFNASDTIILSEYLWSDELDSILTLLENFPEFYAVAMATIERVLTKPEEVKLPSNWADLCTDLALFSDVFVVDASSISAAELQHQVCDVADVDFEKLLYEVQNNRVSVRTFLDAIELLNTNFTLNDIRVDATQVLAEQVIFGQLLEALIVDPPDILLTPTSSWMEESSYTQGLQSMINSMEQLMIGFADSSFYLAWQGNMLKAVLPALATDPQVAEAMAYIDVILDVAASQVATSSGNLDELRKYPNANIMLNLLKETPEAIETILYTVITQQDKTALWGFALQSWETFCSTPVDTIMTVPDGLNFSMTNFLAQACSLNVEVLIEEFAAWQGIDRLEALMYGAGSTVNVSSIIEKIDQLAAYAMNVVDPNAADDLMANLPFNRLFDENVWNNIGTRVGEWTTAVAVIYESPTQIVKTITQTLTDALGGIAEEVFSIVETVVEVTDILLGQIIVLMDSNDLNTAVAELPEMQKLVDLLNQVPELYETVLYTAIMYPDKLTGSLAQATSFEAFCKIDPHDMLVVAPGSNFDLVAFVSDLCSLDIDELVEGIGNYTVTQQITDAINGQYNGSITIESLIDNVEKLVSRLEEGLDLADRVFQPEVWAEVMERTTSWIWNYTSPTEFVKLEQQRLFLSLIAYLESSPDGGEILRYLDAVLDLIGDRIEGVQTNLSAVIQDRPNLSLVVDLLNEVPELIETLLYTILAQPTKMSNFIEAIVSYETLCTLPVDSYMSVPPGSSFDVAAYIGQLCSVDFEELVAELTDLRGLGRFQEIAAGTDMSQVNITELLLKAEKMFTALGEIYDDPESLGGITSTNPWLFDETIWNEVGQKVMEWLSTAEVDYTQPENIVQAVTQVFDSLGAMSPELKDAFDRATAMAAIMIDELSMLVQETSLGQAYANISSLRLLIDLANYAPQIYETVIYTSIFHPEQASAQSEALVSLEAFCMADPSTLFTVPPSSSFDLQAWTQQFCSMNLTLLEEEMTNYATAKAIEEIVSGQPLTSSVDLTSLLAKIDEIISQIESGWTLQDPMLNPTVWEEAMLNVEGWLANYTLDTSILMSFDAMADTLNQLSNDPNLFDALMVLTLPGVIGDELMDRLLKLENIATIELADLVSGWPSMEHLLELAQMPGALDIMAASADSPQFQQLFMNETAIADFCSMSTPPTDYLKAAQGTTEEDLQKFREEFCKIDFANFLDGFNNIIDIERVERVLEGSEALDWTQVFDKVERVVQLLTVTWENKPPTFYLPEHWLNESYWMSFFDVNLGALEDPTTLKEQLESVVKSLEEVLQTEGLRETGLVLNAVLEILNENIAAMQGATYTLESAVDYIPALKSLFYSLGLDSNTLMTILEAPITNTTLFAELFLSDDFQTDFCTSDRWKEILGLSDDFDTSGLFQAVCVTGDIDAMLESLVQTFSLESLVQALENSASPAGSWDMVVENVFKLIDNMETLLENPPSLNLDDPKLQAVLNSYTNTDDLWELLSALSVLQNIFSSDSNVTGGTDIATELETVLQVPLAVTSVLTELMARLKVQNGQLDLAAIFEDVPQVVEVINSFLDLNPDPLTGIAGIMLKANTVDYFLSIMDNPTALSELFCDEDKFESVFTVQPDVDLSQLLSAMCGLNFSTIAQELMESLGLSVLTQDSSEAFDMESFAADIGKAISFLMNITEIDYITFDSHDLGSEFAQVNITRLAELLNTQYNDEDAFTRDYIIISATILNDLLASIGTTGGDELTLALKFVEVYMSSFNSFLESVQDQPISLQLLMNNTEVGDIVNAILADPSILDGLVNAKIHVEELAAIIQSPDAVTLLCGVELWTAVEVPAEEKAAMEEVQKAACTANTTLLLWQTIMVQANGYQLMQQLEILADEISKGETTMNATAVTEEVTQFVTYMQAIIEDFMSGARSLDDLIDLQGFEALLTGVEDQVAQMLIDQAENWSVDLAQLIFPNVMDDVTYQNMAKTLNTVNLFMNVTIAKLQGIKNGEISLETVFADADELVALIEAYIRVGENIAQLWTDDQINSDALLSLAKLNATELQSLCAQSGAMAQTLMQGTGQPSQTVEDLAILVCSLVTDNFLSEAQDFVEYDKIMTEMETIWTSTAVVPDYAVFASNVQQFTDLVTELASATLTVDSDILDFNSILEDLQNIGENPEIIFRLLQLAGLVVDGMVTEDRLTQQIMSGINTYLVLPMINVLNALEDKGISLSTITDDPDQLIDIMQVMLDFDVQYSVIESILVRSEVNYIATYQSEICNRTITFAAQGLTSLSLPTNISLMDVASTICSSNPDGDAILEALKDLGLSDSQIVAYIGSAVPVQLAVLYYPSYLLEMYDSNLGWVELMANLETLTHLVTLGELDSAGLDGIRDTWTVVKDLVFNSTVNSFFSIMSIFDSQIPQTEEWTTFKQVLSLLTSVMNLVESNIDGFVKDGTVRLEDVLPSSDRVTQLLDTIFGPSSAGEVLATIIDIDMVYRITLEDMWQKVCQDGVENHLLFPDGINVTAVTENLCRAVTTQTSSWQELLALFNAQDVLAEMNAFLAGSLSPSTSSSTVFDAMNNAIQGLVSTAEQLVGSSLDAQSMTSWVDGLTNWANGLQQDENAAQLVEMCNSLSYFVKDTAEYQTIKSYLVTVINSISFAVDMARIIPELDELTCIFVGGSNGYDIAGTLDKMASLGLWQAVEQMIAVSVDPNPTLDCSGPVTAYQNLTSVITSASMAGPAGLDLDTLNMCLAAAPAQLEAMFESVSSTTTFLRQVLEFSQIPGLVDLLQSEDIAPMLDFFIQAVNDNEEVFLQLEKVLSNSTALRDYLQNTLGLSESLTNTFLNASVNIDWVTLLTTAPQEMAAVLCDPVQLGSVLKLPQDTSLNISSIVAALCDQGVLNTVAEMASLSLPLSTVEQMLGANITFSNFIVDLSEDLADLITEFSDIIQLVLAALTDFTFDMLQDQIPVLDEILQGNGLSQMAQTTHDILDSLMLVLPQNEQTTMVVEDIRVILDGLFALDALTDVVLGEIQVKDLAKDPDYLRFYLTTQLGFNDSVTDTIMNAAFSSGVLLISGEAENITCDEVLDRLLITNTTENCTAGSVDCITVDDLSKILCNLTQSQIEILLNQLTPLLEIEDLVLKYVTHTTETVLSTTSMTPTELSDMVETIDQGLANLQLAADIIDDTPNATQLLDAFYGASTSGSLSASELTPTLCGNDVQALFEPEFPTGSIILVVPDNVALDGLSQEDQIELEILDLPNEFCVSVYESVRDSPLGNILWAYLKPIMRGKILYTPDNEVTRAILREANGTFALLAEVYDVASRWADLAGNLKMLADTMQELDDLEEALENSFVRGLVEAALGISADSLVSSLDALTNGDFNTSQIEALQTAAEFVANYTSCIETDRFVPVANEEEMEQTAFELSQMKNFFAGIVFLDMDEDSQQSNNRRKRQAEVELPKHIIYKIRMDVDNTMDTNKLKSSIWKLSAEDNFIEDMRYMRGFIHIQDMLDTAIIKLQKNEILDSPRNYIRQMPFPCHHLDSFVFLLGAYLIPVMMTFVFMASLGVATHNFVYDRENGQEATLGVMGMVSGLNFIMWLISTLIVMSVTCLVMAVMLKYTDIFKYSNMLIVFIYLLEFCFSSLMLLYMVSSFFTRTTMAILFVLMIYLISYMPYIVLVSMEVTMSFEHKLVACLSSTTAFSFGSLTLSYLEESGRGLQWDNIDKDVTRDFSLKWSFIMMAFDSAVYFLVGWYVRNVKPGKYGLPQPWYFPVLPTYWCSCLKWRPGFKPVEQCSAPMFESPPEVHSVGVAVKNLTKRYGCSKKNAVDNLTVNFYENQITTLLGHNGAAKTTTLKILYGVLEPTSGKVMINGQQPGCGKQSIGICPQQNALFDYMTVKQHMEFYVAVKGNTQPKPKAIAEIKKLLRDVDLWHARKTPVKDLSYGMKRRLCVALAFVGGSKTVILDEPTSGVDPHARKNIWNLITENRHDRTILLSTHHLDEADILSDRIALLHQGKLLCCGSPAFLKRCIGRDFRLTVKKADVAPPTPVYDNSAQAGPENPASPPLTKKNTQHNDSITTFIRSMCPDAVMVEEVGTDLTYNMPKDADRMTVPIDQFFRKLDAATEELGVDTYGVSDTTLEEVFLTLTMKADSEEGEERGVVNPVMTTRDELVASADPEKAIPSGSGFPNRFPGQDKFLFSPAAKIQLGPTGGTFASTDYDNDGQSSSRGSAGRGKRRTGATLSLCQIGAMLVKRFHHYRRNWRIIVSAVLMPVASLLLAARVATLRVDEGDMKALTLDPSIYGPGTTAFYSDVTKNSMSTSFVDVLTDPDIGYGSTCRRSWPDNYLGNDTCVLPDGNWSSDSRPFYMVTCVNAWQVYTEMPDMEYTVYERRVASDDTLQYTDQNIASYILRTFRDYIDKRFGGFTFEYSQDGDISTTESTTWFNSKGYHAMPSFFNTMSNTILRAQLYETKVKEEYGITAINHPIKLGKAPLSVDTLGADAADAGLALMIVAAFSFIPSGFLLYIINERVQKERQLQNLRGISVLTYWVVALIWDLFVYSLTVGMAVAIVCIFETDGFYIRQNLGAFATVLMLYGWAVIPMLYCLSHLFNEGSTAYLVSFCLNLFLALATVISLLVMQLFRDTKGAWRAYKICKYGYLVFPQFALGQGLMDMVANTFMYKLFERFDVDRYLDPYSFDVMGYNLIALASQGAFFFLLNLIVDGFRRRPLSIPRKYAGNQGSENSSHMDVDVVRERDRVKENGTRREDMLVVDDLSKVYRRGWKKFMPVDHVTFGVHEGECFGLLGVNGAGKTTTFRMLTGDSKPAGGKAFLRGDPLSFSDKKFGHDIGYCPQEGGLDDYLTGEETLYFHSRLKGFNAKQTEKMSNELLEQLGLEKFRNMAVHKYSGGTKKKLALAVALLGEPSILYLDEPTTGMDAVTRRLAWSCIAQANRNGQSVVLTSHSMGECDALCSRIAIMVNGQIKCIGSPQHLKNKFGDGYTVVIHADQENVNAVTNRTLNVFPGTVIKSKHVSRVELLIPYQVAQVADIVAYLQSAEDQKAINYYSLSQTSLDTVFINFAQEQSDNSEDQISSSGGSTSWGKTTTPSGSVSSQGKVPIEEEQLPPAPKKLDNVYAFENPQFVNDETGRPATPSNVYPVLDSTRF